MCNKLNIFKLALRIILTAVILSSVPMGVLAADSISVQEYKDSPYVQVNGNKPYFTDREKAKTNAFDTYSRLDSLGRCGVAYANICKQLMPTEKRGAIGMVKPSGWHTVKYNGLVDGNYLYNRCHLIGYQLAGENANERNLITGTRYLNVEGMLPFEDEVADYVNSTGNHVLYRVTPKFSANNLVADGVEIEAWSVEDSGKGVCFNVFCYNVQPGIEIDYATGNSALSGKKPADAKSQNPYNKKNNTKSQNTNPVVVASNHKETSETYIANTNTKRFHKPACSSVGDMAEKNIMKFEGSRSQLINQGYQPCKRCNP